jgi:Domain of unknown function (DUF4126)
MNAVNMDTTQLFALAAALGWASGLRLYAVVFFTGLAGYLGWVTLPSGLHVLQNPLLLGASGLMLALEFFADKIPGLDSVWDSVHTFIRIPAGMALAAGVFGGDSTAWATIAALMGGALAATSHTAKTTTRLAANTSPEPFSNIGLSLLGDAAVPSMLWLAWTHPAWFFVALALALVLMVSLIVVLFRFLRALARRWKGRLDSSSPAAV